MGAIKIAVSLGGATTTKGLPASTEKRDPDLIEIEVPVPDGAAVDFEYRSLVGSVAHAATGLVGTVLVPEGVAEHVNQINNYAGEKAA